jgi:ABC-2 type transport system ATP-binding protein
VILELGALPSEAAAELPGADAVTTDEVSLDIQTREPAKVLSALAERGNLDGLQVRTATLEDVFLQLTGREYRP